MNPPQADTLPLPQRIALAHAHKGRSELRSFFLFDHHCARIMRHAREPMLAQIRYRWWREAIIAGAASADPLLAQIRAWPAGAQALVALTQGWERLATVESMEEAVITEFASCRAQGFAAYAYAIGEADQANAATLAGRRWALADLACHLAKESERKLALMITQALDQTALRPMRALRPLCLLDGLARRSLARGGAPMLGNRTDMLVALRLGLFGR